MYSPLGFKINFPLVGMALAHIFIVCLYDSVLLYFLEVDLRTNESPTPLKKWSTPSGRDSYTARFSTSATRQPVYFRVLHHVVLKDTG